MSEFNKLNINGKEVLPIVQGGMGVGISASSLSSAVAKEGGVGTIASIDLRHLHPDLNERCQGAQDESIYNEMNHIALDREIKKAKQLSEGKGLIAVNIMKAVKDYVALVRQSCISGADAIVMGAGLPLDLPKLTEEFPKVGLIPILSESRGINIVLKRWMKDKRLPSAIVIEHPNHAGGHLGSPKMEELGDEKFSFQRVLDETREVFKNLGLEREKIPLIIAGGMASFSKIKNALLNWGADAVQIGTAFAVTKEGDASIRFKETLAGAKDEDIVEFMSVAGLPARAVLTPFLKNYLNREAKLQERAKCDEKRCTQRMNCLGVCGLRDGMKQMGQFCIDLKLSAAFRGELDKGLFFRGKDPLPFGDKIRSVKETMSCLLSGQMPEDLKELLSWKKEYPKIPIRDVSI